MFGIAAWEHYCGYDPAQISDTTKRTSEAHKYCSILTYAFAYVAIGAGGSPMKSINITQARKDLYNLVNEVNYDSCPVTLTNTRGKNAVLISEDDWNALQETVYLNSIPGFVESVVSKDEPLEERAVYDPNEEW